MRLRTYILISLLISQPVGAFSSAWQMTAGQGGDPATHCGTGGPTSDAHTGHDAGHNNPSSGEHTDCELDCGSCASCAAGMTSVAFDIEVHPPLGHSAPPNILLPPGNTDLLFRPPINA